MTDNECKICTLLTANSRCLLFVELTLHLSCLCFRWVYAHISFFCALHRFSSSNIWTKIICNVAWLRTWANKYFRSIFNAFANQIQNGHCYICHSTMSPHDKNLPLPHIFSYCEFYCFAIEFTFIALVGFCFRWFLLYSIVSLCLYVNGGRNAWK